MCTFGVSFLCSQWFVRVRVFLTLSPCSLPEADVVVVTTTDKRQDVVPVSRLPSFASISIQASSSPVLHGDDSIAPFPATGIGIKGDGCDRMLEYRCGRYLYSHSVGTFLPVPSVPEGFIDELMGASNSRRIKGQLTDEWQRNDRRVVYGPNELLIPVKTPLQLLGEEMVHPFYVFQYASVAIWCMEAYYSYSAIIVAITMFSILATVVQAYRYRRRLAALAHFTCEVQVLQPGGSVAILSSSELVPGDVVVVRAGLLPCDLVLLRGEAIVDENMLTGEAVPVRKVSYSPANDGPGFDPDIHKACTLYGGTTVAQVRPGGAERLALGVVCRTSFWTAKGQLLKSILFPRQHRETFASDSMAFIAVMLCLGLLFYIWDIIALSSYGAPAGFIILRYLDLVTVAVPPALPACLTVATAIAVSRLAEHSIFVSNPAAINAAGHLNIICFDKTGTLTEPGLDLLGVVPVVSSERTTTTVQEEEEEGNPDRPWLPRCAELCKGSDADPLPVQFQEVLATCHGLAQLDGELVGDPLDQRLFEATGWRMMDDGAGAPVEIVTVAEEGYEDIPGEHIVAASPRAAGTPRHRVPGSPGVLTTAHVQTKVRPPESTALALGGPYTIIRRFEFSSEKQRNMVVCRHPDGSVHAHVKGSPEMVRKLADPGSIPLDFDTELGKHTREGLRVLGLATRRLQGLSEAEIQTLNQDDFEFGLQFMGFAVMMNPLRGDTALVLKELHSAGIRTVMVTGDHARTAVSVAHQCGMLERGRSVVMIGTTSDEGRVEDTELQYSLAKPDGSVSVAAAGGESDVLLQGLATGEIDAAVTGRGFERLGVDSDAGGGGLETVLHCAGVFARMSPDDKRLLMELLGDGTVAEDGEESPGLGHHVGFCGDGANDVGALKAAHVGVSLCEAEASVAAPLTSKRQSIACMVAVVAEGRCSLDTSYLIFKFIIVYAFIQVFGVNLMYSFGGSVGNYQYLIQDLLYTTVLAGTMGFTRPAVKLTVQRPPDRLMSAGIWFPVIAQFVVCAAFQLGALGMLSRESWYVRFNPEPGATGTNCFARATSNSPECSQSWENSVVFIMSLGQFLITALVFNKGPPHRRPIHTNAYLLLGKNTNTTRLNDAFTCDDLFIYSCYAPKKDCVD